jgi:acrylyl-CoA reductase (NADPH)
MFKALLVDQADGRVRSEIRELSDDDLPEGDVTVRVAYSSLNYKDGLALTGRGKVIHCFPLVPGIDMAGIVEESSSSDYKPGDRVILTGWGCGESRWGGFTYRTRVSSATLLPLPLGMTLKQSMAIGTAGLTAMLSVLSLRDNLIMPDCGDIVVSGASGGVGGIAVAILAQLGYRVVASTGKPEYRDYLKALGASEVIGREDLSRRADKPLDHIRWGGGIDSVGSATLAGMLNATRPFGAVAACGLAGGSDLHTTVMPFILRGVTLIGIHSGETPQNRRRAAWNSLVNDLPFDLLDAMTATARLEDLPRLAEEILAGRIRGRTVIELDPPNDDA